MKTLSLLIKVAPYLRYAFPNPGRRASAVGLGMWLLFFGVSSVWASNTEPFADQDGDRVPNLWETQRGFDPNNPLSVPAYDATVDYSLDEDPALNRFQTLQAAYDSLPTVPGYRSIVFVKRGFYPCYLDTSAVPRKVAWIGELGGKAESPPWSSQRARGEEGIVFQDRDASGNLGITLTDETVLDGVIIGYQSALTVDPEGPWNVPAMTILPAQGGANPEVRLINSIFRNLEVRCYTEGGAPAVPAAILNIGGSLKLDHCSVVNCYAFDEYQWEPLYAVENRSGGITLRNSYIMESDFGTALQNTGTSTFVTSIVQGMTGSGLLNPATPGFTGGGYLMTNAGARNVGTLIGLKYDIHGEVRPTGANTTDIGPDEVIFTTGDGETTADSLPDWWEYFWFGDKSKTNTGDPDGDLVAGASGSNNDNLSEFYANEAPTDFQDPNDTLKDSWELFWWVHLGVANQGGDPDMDGFVNGVEMTNLTNPLVMESTADTDGDDLYDVWEIHYFGSITAQGKNGNADLPIPDGRTNYDEFLAGTHPAQTDPDFDGDHDGLFDVWEFQYFTSTGIEGGLDNNDGDSANNLAEQAADTSPLVADNFGIDNDGDGFDDTLEMQWFQDLDETLYIDSDGDGLTNYEEIHVYHTNPADSDTNDDGMPDGLAVGNGISPTNNDPDGDRLLTIDEIAKGTNPYLWDSDGDGEPDDTDKLPLDPPVGTDVTSIANAAPIMIITSPAP